MEPLICWSKDFFQAVQTGLYCINSETYVIMRSGWMSDECPGTTKEKIFKKSSLGKTILEGKQTVSFWAGTEKKKPLEKVCNP